MCNSFDFELDTLKACTKTKYDLKIKVVDGAWGPALSIGGDIVIGDTEDQESDKSET